ncbi:MAG: hypothetical protein N3E51_00385 [Candidatus Micrarchaeota archaeon]|nr:hypothetical protein [Candidatus Micrarchaeota archaeon]
MGVAMQNPQALPPKTAEECLKAKSVLERKAEARHVFLLQKMKERLEKDFLAAQDTGRVVCSKKILGAYMGMDILKSEKAQGAMKEALVEESGDRLVYDLAILRKRCAELGMKPDEIEMLENILKAAH